MRIVYIFADDLEKTKGTSIRAKNLLGPLCKDNEVLLLSKKKVEFISRNVNQFETDNLRSWEVYRKYKEIVRKFNPDVILSINYPSALIGHYFSRRLHTPHVIDVHSLVADDLYFMKGQSRYSLGSIYLSFLEKYIYSKATKLLSVSYCLADKLRQINPNVGIVPIGTDIDHLNNLSKDGEVMKMRKTKKDCVFVGYAGNFYQYQGLKYLFAAIRKFEPKHLKIHFVFIGAHEKYEDQNVISELIKRGDVTFFGIQPYERTMKILSSLDVLVVPRNNDVINTLSFPSKLIEYMGSRKVVIASNIGDIPKVIIDEKTGLLIKPESVDSIINALKHVEDPVVRRRLSKNAYRLAKEEYSNETIYRKLIKELESI